MLKEITILYDIANSTEIDPKNYVLLKKSYRCEDKLSP